VPRGQYGERTHKKAFLKHFFNIVAGLAKHCKPHHDPDHGEILIHHAEEILNAFKIPRGVPKTRRDILGTSLNLKFGFRSNAVAVFTEGFVPMSSRPFSVDFKGGH
jgi:hypothetical protein